MIGERFSREVAGSLQADVRFSARPHGVTAVSSPENAAPPDPTLGHAKQRISLSVTMLVRGHPRSALAAAGEACRCASHRPQDPDVDAQALQSALDNAAVNHWRGAATPRDTSPLPPGTS